MAKQTHNPQVGDLVAFNSLPSATWFRVIVRDGFNLTVKEHGKDFAAQHIDVCAVAQVRKAESDLFVEFTGKNARLVSYGPDQLRHILSSWTPMKLADAKRMAKSHGAQLTMADGQ